MILSVLLIRNAVKRTTCAAAKSDSVISSKIVPVSAVAFSVAALTSSPQIDDSVSPSDSLSSYVAQETAAPLRIPIAIVRVSKSMLMTFVS